MTRFVGAVLVGLLLLCYTTQPDAEATPIPVTSVTTVKQRIDATPI